MELSNLKIYSVIAFISSTIILIILFLLKLSGIILILVGFIGYIISLILYLISKNNKKLNYLLLKTLIFILGLSLLFSSIDYFRIKNNTNPLFVILINKYMDGGSKEYIGLGYKVIKCNTLNGDNSYNIGFYNLNINNVCISSDEIYSLYIKIIDILMTSKRSNDSEFLALDLDSFKLLDNHQENSILKYSEKYHSNVIKSNYTELNENNINEELELKGYLISIDKFNKNNNIINIEFGIYKESLGANGYCYQAKLKNNIWYLKVKCKWIS